MREPKERIADMLDMIARIEKYAIRGKDTFIEDELVQTYIVHNLQVLSEAAYKLPDDFRKKHTGLPWKQMLGMRHILVHGYFDIDLDIVWSVVEKDLPAVKPELRKLLEKQDITTKDNNNADDLTHPVKKLFNLFKEYGFYDDTEKHVKPIPDEKIIPGTAFFPGGHGLWGTGVGKPLPPAPINGVMILGHYFDSVKGFNDSYDKGKENLSSPTWSTTISWLDTAKIPKERCFFTNFFMCLGQNTTGSLTLSEEYISRCKYFLIKQIEIMKPKLIFTLGLDIIPHISSMFKDISDVWGKRNKFKSIDNKTPIINNVRINESLTSVFAVLVHPCYAHINIDYRTYQGKAGYDAQIQLMKDAFKIANVM